MFNALDAHPNIQIRIFNPFTTPSPSFLSKVGQLLLEWQRLNRRMHNKSFIVDNTVAIIGGRNIGDNYFDDGFGTNFSDLDLVAIGPAVREASFAFDNYWNCNASYPLKAFPNPHDAHADLAELRVALARDARTFAQSDYAKVASQLLPNGATSDRRGDWFWGMAELIADQPGKINQINDVPALRIGPKLRIMINAAQSDVLLISAYFIPGKDSARFLVGLARRGVHIQLLTNSLASNDEPIVHAGYARYRRQLLEAGVQIYELQPAPGAAQPTTARGRSSGVSLHAKAIVVDHEYVFIGSLNMDPRSKLLNTEVGLIVDSVPLANAVTQFFDDARKPENTFQVVLRPVQGGAFMRMDWLYTKSGAPVVSLRDPMVTTKRRMEVFVLHLLPIESLL
jgi:putative cardiolipin synthase